MKRTDRIKPAFIINWSLPGKERLSHLFSLSAQLKQSIKDGIVCLTTKGIAIYTIADNYIEWNIMSNAVVNRNLFCIQTANA